MPSSSSARVLRETVARPDAKDRVGLGALVRLLSERLGGHAPSSFVAQLLDDNRIVLRPRIEVDPEELEPLVLGKADRDAFVKALRNPPSPNKALRRALRRHQDISRKA